MPVNNVGGLSSNTYNEMLSTQAGAVSNNSAMEMDDFWQLLAAQLQYQDMSNPMSNSEMMTQMTQMASMNAMQAVSNAVANFGTVTNNLAQVILTQYSTSMIGKEVTVAVVDENGEVVGEKQGVVTGVDLTGAQYVYIDGEKYELTQIMKVGDVPEEDKEDTEGGDAGSGGAEGEDAGTEGTEKV